MSDRLYGNDYFDPNENSRFASNELTPETEKVYNNAKMQLEVNNLDSRINKLTEMINSLQSELTTAKAKKAELLSEIAKTLPSEENKPNIR